ncbi:MAG: GH32 C-terminal domain-containing protein [Oscillospiraceae bacterium]|nr:GH32 C-terminal domain-containing protein [Oscillospiraceae bacterium]
MNSYRRFDIRLAADEKHYFQISYDPYNNVVTVDRFHTGCTKDVLHSRSFTVADRAGELKLRIVMDRQSVEIFANDGEDAATFVFFTPLSADGISFHVDGEANLAIEKYDLTI